MSDIGLTFPPWASLAIYGFDYWLVIAPAGLAFAAIGWFGRALPRLIRIAAWSLAAACSVPFVLLLVLILVG